MENKATTQEMIVSDQALRVLDMLRHEPESVTVTYVVRWAIKAKCFEGVRYLGYLLIEIINEHNAIRRF